MLRKVTRDALAKLALVAMCTAIPLMNAPDWRVVGFASASLLQGAIATLVVKHEGGAASQTVALFRLAALTPILAMPLLYLVFRQGLGWPFMTVWSAWALGNSLCLVLTGSAESG